MDNQDQNPAAASPPETDSPMETTNDERTMAMLMYILAIVTGWVGPLIIWLLKKETSPLIDQHGKEVLNFQITFFIAYIIAAMLTFVVVGCFILPVLVIVSLIFCIQGAMAANKGLPYRFPFAIRLIK